MNTFMMYAGYVWSVMAMLFLVVVAVAAVQDEKRRAREKRLSRNFTRIDSRIWTDSTPEPKFWTVGSPMAAYYRRLSSKETARRFINSLEGINLPDGEKSS